MTSPAEEVAALRGENERLRAALARALSAEEQFARFEASGALAQVAERTSNGVLLSGRDGRVAWVNASFSFLTGYRAEEAVGRTPAELFPATEPADAAFMRDAVASGRPFHLSLKSHARDGREFRAHLEAHPLRDASGTLTHWVWLMSDVTASHDAQVALERTVNKLSAIVHGAKVGIIATDLTGRITEFNAEAEAMLGYRAEEVVGRATPELFHEPEELVQRARALSQALGTEVAPGFEALVADVEPGQPRDGETIYVHRDEHPVPVFLSVSALTGSAGEKTGYLGVALDLTASRRAAQVERAAAERLAKLAAQVPGVIYQFQQNPDGSSCFPYASEGIRHIYRVTPQQVHDDASDVFKVLHPDDLPQVAASISESARTLSPWKCEYRVMFDDGTVAWRKGASVPELLPGGAVLWHGFITDVTQEKEAEAELVRAREEAFVASRAKSEFLANMSHEIRTPLNGILGLTQLVLETPLQPDQREGLGAVLQSGQTLLTLINDILDLSKVEAGRLSLEALPFSLQDIVDDVVRSLQTRAAEKQLELVVELAAEVPERLVGDPTRLRQVLVNLLGNAVKFTQVGEVSLVARWASGRLDLSVHDTGIGVPERARARIFEPFTQVDGSTTRRYGGTGLGLAITRRLVEAMGGSVEVESREGTGSTFTVSLPLEAVPGPTRVTPPRRGSVLLIDDHPHAREVLARGLVREGYEVAAFGDGPRALQALREGALVDLKGAVVDLGLPDFDGAMLAEVLRRDPRFGARPVVVLTSSAVGLTQAQRERAQPTTTVVKPARAAVVRAALEAGEGARLEAARTPPRPLAVVPRRLEVLVAEDNPVNATVVRTLLSREGHAVTVVGTGTAAVEASAAQAFDLCLMDMQMPELDGLEATALIRARERGTGQRLPIIALTANAMKGDLERCTEAGMDDYLSKPLDLRALRARLQALAQQLDARARRWPA
jgi:PAS domain S-box-containing protein